ncbi:MAG: bile acid:sodium symporter family protein [Paludibacteraceae bacterium]|nr:bile acid:sodium symporter family protein [Paludibacteraceae bacterium]
MMNSQIPNWIASHITLIVVAVTIVALFVPSSFSWIGTAAIAPMLGVVMFGMGLTLKPSDFKPVLMHPKEMLIGELAQFIIMPLVAWLLCRLLNLPPELALGVILVGCCPGGTASNVICYLAKGDVALSVAMTGVSTLLAPFVTPVLVLLLAGETVDVDVLGMFMSIVQVVILPIVVGLVVNHYFGKFTQRVIPYMPMLSTLAIAAIIGIIVSHNAQNIMGCSLLVAVAVILHNLLGLSLGYIAGMLTGMSPEKRTAISIEVGMQNSGLASSLAATHFALYPLAAVPGAIFSVWHNFSGSIAAGVLKRWNGK